MSDWSSLLLRKVRRMKKTIANRMEKQMLKMKTVPVT